MSREITRRRLFAVGGAGLSAMALSGCLRQLTPSGHQMVGPLSGITAGPPGPGDFEHGRRGGQVVTAWTAEGNSYDAAIGYDLHSWEALTSLLYMPLYRLNGQLGGAEPGAAAAMPQVSSDGRRYVIPLRQGFRFHNGREIVAADYIYAWTRVLNPKTESWAQGYFTGIRGAHDYIKHHADSVAGLQALDDHTLVVELEEPDITLLGMMCLPFASALPREEVEKLGDDFNRRPVGNGPFRVASYDAKRRQSVFVRNEHYPWAGVPFLDRVVYRWGIDPSVQFLQMQAGDVDILGEGLAASVAARVQGKEQLRETYTKSVPVLGISYAEMNTKSPKLTDPRVRQALNYATDRDQLSRYSRGLQSAWGTALPQNEPNFPRIATPYGLDLDRARSLLRAAGVTSLELDFYCNDDDFWRTATQVLQQQWKQVDVDIKITNMSNAAFWTAVGKGQADVWANHWYQVAPSGLDVVTNVFTSTAGSNYSGYASDEVDALVARSMASRTEKASNQLLAQAEKLITEDAPAVFVGSLNFIAMRAPRVQNYQIRGETGSYYDRMWV